MKPQVSVIITNNNLMNLSRCLSSVLNQTFKEYEVIIIDDVFNKETKKIIESFLNLGKEIRYIYKNIKIRAIERSIGERLALGKIIVMTDSDCIVPDNWIEEMVKPVLDESYDAVQGRIDIKVDNFWSRQLRQRSEKEFNKSNGITGKINGKNFAIKAEVIRILGFSQASYLTEADTALSVRFQKQDFKLKFFSGIKVKSYRRYSFIKTVSEYFYKGMWHMVIAKENESYLKTTNFFARSTRGFWLFLKLLPEVIKSLARFDFGSAYFNLITGLAYVIGLTRGQWFVFKKNLNQLRAVKSTLQFISIFKMKFKWLIPWFHRKYHPNLKTIGLDLTMACSNCCFNCEASVRQAPSREHMSLDQINGFIDESLMSNREWNIITLRGGEPTLHPEFFEILNIVKRYKDRYPLCRIKLQTNNYGQKVREIIARTPAWLEIESSEKKGIYNPEFKSYNAAPVDLMFFKFCRSFFKGCWRTEKCHIALTRYGYYPCSPGANIDRVFGFDIGIKKLSLINEKVLRSQLNRLCRYCGHFKEPNETVDREKISKSWRKSYQNYKTNKPGLTLY